MLPPGKSKVTALILAMRKPKADSSSQADEPSADEPSDEGGDSMGMEACADDILRAIQRDDAKALCRALCDFLELHEGCGEPEEE